MEPEEAEGRITLAVSAPHPCQYLPGRIATVLFIDFAELNPAVPYGVFLQSGFRRSGTMVYRPQCSDCRRCASARIPVERFAPRRRHRRNLRKNRDMTTRFLPGEFREEHYRLFTRYLAARHPGGPMSRMTAEDYVAFLGGDSPGTLFIELRLEETLVEVMVIDVLPNALSSVYTFYEPTLASRGLGTFGILWQIEEARRRGLDYVYIGYWIPGCPKMDYKGTFEPLEIYRDGRWVVAVAPDA